MKRLLHWLLIVVFSFTHLGCRSGGGGTTISPPVMATPVVQPTSGATATPVAAATVAPLPATANGLVIVSPTDGAPQTTGQTIVLQAVAGDAQGQDISSRIVWSDSRGTQLGTGATLNYGLGDQARMESLTAAVPGGPSQKVSFTVSPTSIKIAAKVKVLPDNVAPVELGSSRLILKAEENLPTLNVGDVVIGGVVPPLRLNGVQRQGSNWVLQVSDAQPKEVIEQASVVFEPVTLDLSSQSPAEGVTLFSVSPQPQVLDILPRWAGFRAAGEAVAHGLTVQSSGTLRWRPSYVGSLSFNKNVGNGLAQAFIAQNGDIVLNATLRAQGFSTWREGKTFFGSLLAPQKRRLVIPVGPAVRSDSLWVCPGGDAVGCGESAGGAKF